MTHAPRSPSLPAVVAAEQTYLQIPSHPEWIAPTVEYLKDKAILCGACDPTRARKLTLALHEALTNSVIHGNLELPSDLRERHDNAFTEALAARAADPNYGLRPVEMSIDYDGERCRWTFTDQGNGFDVEGTLARAAQAETALPLCSGRGILLMRAFLDDVHYEMGGRRAILTLARPSGEEKRRGARLPMERPIRVAPLRPDGMADWDAAYEAVSRDISLDGMSILQARLAVSERILLGIDWQGQFLYVPAEVRHCQARDGDTVELGCRFLLSPSSADKEGAAKADLQHALGSLLEEVNAERMPSDDRRAHPRATYTARILVEKGPDGECLVGFSRDLSRGGISFLTSAPLPLGNVVLTLPHRTQKPLRVVARIVRCNQLVAGVFDVGACFLDVADSPENF
jgi:anti-sigma regulatory factor (Ser/Thr protein kinase)